MIKSPPYLVGNTYIMPTTSLSQVPLAAVKPTLPMPLTTRLRETS
jgi:hypothetical protein